CSRVRQSPRPTPDDDPVDRRVQPGQTRWDFRLVVAHGASPAAPQLFSLFRTRPWRLGLLLCRDAAAAVLQRRGGCGSMAAGSTMSRGRSMNRLLQDLRIVEFSAFVAA